MRRDRWVGRGKPAEPPFGKGRAMAGVGKCAQPYLIGGTLAVVLCLMGQASARPETNTTAPNSAPPDASNSTPQTEIDVRQPTIHTRPIQKSVDMVVVAVTVTDPFDRIVTGLDQNNFEVFDD